MVQQGHALHYAIESYFLDNEQYPDSKNIETLIDTLIKEKYLKKEPKNPYTKQEFTQDDSSGKIQFLRSNDSFSLRIFGRNNDSIIFGDE